MSKISLIHSTQKAGPNTEIYGPRSEYGFLQTVRRPIRMQDSSKPYNKVFYYIKYSALLGFRSLIKLITSYVRLLIYDNFTCENYRFSNNHHSLVMDILYC